MQRGTLLEFFSIVYVTILLISAAQMRDKIRFEAAKKSEAKKNGRVGSADVYVAPLACYDQVRPIPDPIRDAGGQFSSRLSVDNKVFRYRRRRFRAAYTGVYAVLARPPARLSKWVRMPAAGRLLYTVKHRAPARVNNRPVCDLRSGISVAPAMQRPTSSPKHLSRGPLLRCCCCCCCGHRCRTASIRPRHVIHRYPPARRPRAAISGFVSSIISR